MAKSPEIDLREDYLRNYLINGDMRISQRGTSFSAVADSTYTLDRMQYLKSTAPNATTAVHTISQDSLDFPTVAQAGYLFQNSIRLNLTTADTSIAAGEYVAITQKVEGYNWAAIAQRPFTLSFWVKATLTGTYCVSFKNSGKNRTYVAEYTINATDTWEYKTITVSASPSAGTWDYTNGIGLQVSWALASGSTYQTTANAWQTGDYLATANQVNGVNTGAADFRLTGIQINGGSEALPFSLAGRSFGSEFILCQSYYEKSYPLTTPPGTVSSGNGAVFWRPQLSGIWSAILPPVRFRVQKRGIPIMKAYNPETGADGSGGTGNLRDFSAGSNRTMTFTNVGNSGAGSDSTDSGTVANNLHGFHWSADAEL